MSSKMIIERDGKEIEIGSVYQITYGDVISLLTEKFCCVKTSLDEICLVGRSEDRQKVRYLGFDKRDLSIDKNGALVRIASSEVKKREYRSEEPEYVKFDKILNKQGIVK